MRIGDGAVELDRTNSAIAPILADPAALTFAAVEPTPREPQRPPCLPSVQAENDQCWQSPGRHLA
jgi:hypothetical protein